MLARKHATFIGPTSILSFLRKKAKLMVKEEGIKHTEALDRLAARAGLPNWKYLRDGVERFRPTEEAYKWGIVVALDQKDADVDPTAPFIRDLLLNTLAVKDKRLIRSYLKIWKSYGDPCSLRDPEVREDLFDMISDLGMLRYVGKEQPKDLDAFLSIWYEHFFFAPMFVWINGEFKVIN